MIDLIKTRTFIHDKYNFSHMDNSRLHKNSINRIESIYFQVVYNYYTVTK